LIILKYIRRLKIIMPIRDAGKLIFNADTSRWHKKFNPIRRHKDAAVFINFIFLFI